MSTPSSDNPFGPFIGSILPYLSQVSDQGTLFDCPMPGISHANGTMASGDMAPVHETGPSHGSIAASGIMAGDVTTGDAVIAQGQKRVE